MISTQTFLRGCLALCVSAAAASSADAQTWPTRPITAVTVFAPGGAADGVARIVSNKLSTLLGQPVVVDNRPGGGGTVGAGAVARAEPDGHTLLMLVSSHTVAETLFKARTYDLVKDFAPVSLIGTSPYWLVVPPQTKLGSVMDLVAAARAEPGRLSYASGGIGSLTHLAAEMMKSQAKLDIPHVPYKGAAPALTDLVTARVDMMFDQPASSEQFVKTGKLKPLAVTTRTRVPTAPDVPTMIEAGFPDFEVASWFAVAVPASTPPAVIDRLNRAMVQALSADDVRRSLEAAGVTPGSSTPEELGALIKKEIPRWRAVVEQAQIKVE